MISWLLVLRIWFAFSLKPFDLTGLDYFWAELLLVITVDAFDLAALLA